MTVAEICKTLGLTGDGIGQQVGVRSPDVLKGAGLAIAPSRVKIVTWNPPDADIVVESTVPRTGKPVVVQLTVDIEDLVPLDPDI